MQILILFVGEGLEEVAIFYFFEENKLCHQILYTEDAKTK